MNPTELPDESVFEAARRLPAGERVAYLDRTCGADIDLRRRVEALLEAFERADGFMHEPAAPEAARTLPFVPAERIGDRIGRYKLLQQIGEGGCGVVYMAQQEEPVRRRVALKVIKLGMDTKQVIARFEAERQALALMDHPNIARVLDAGATDTGRPYFVMELVRGIRITDYCDNHQLAPDDRLRLFIQVCQAVQHAHQKGVIHRDLKPSNILVTVNDGQAVPKVIDFGIAKATQGRLTEQTLFTAFEQFIGTPAYMSPEQAVMTSLDIDTRTDIYSLGVLLYELLTGRTPFDSKDLLARGFDEMRRTIQEQDPPRPSTCLDTLASEALTTTARHRHMEAPRLIHLLRGDLDWIVMKCLEKDRGRRYETANGLARDLDRHLANEPVVARPPTTIYRFQKLVGRHKTAFVAALSIAVVLVIGTVVSVSLAIRATRAEASAQSKEKKAQQVAQFLKNMLRAAEPSVALGRDTTKLREVLAETAKRVGKDLENAPDVEAELRDTMGGVYQSLGDYEQAEAMYRRALELWRKLVGPEDPVVARLLNNLGVTLMTQDAHVEAEALYRQALAMRKRLLGEKDLLVAETQVNLAFLLRRQGRLDEAESLSREALRIRKERLGDDHRDVAESIRGLGIVLWRQGNLGEAERAVREALAMQRRLLGDEHPAVTDMAEDLALVLHSEGNYADAERALRECLATHRRVSGDTHPDTTACMTWLIRTLLAKDNYKEAESLAREALAAREKQMPGAPRTFNARSLLGGCLLGQKRYTEAEPLLLSAYEGLQSREKKIPWEGRYVVTDTLRRIVQLYEASHQPDKAAAWRLKLAEAEKVPGAAMN